MKEFFDKYPWLFAVLAAVAIVAVVLIALFIFLGKGSRHTIKFVTNGAAPIAQKRVSSGSLIKLPTPYKEGYRFAGWFFDPDLLHVALVTTMPKSNLCLYAAWVEDNPAPITERKTILIPEAAESAKGKKPVNFRSRLKEGADCNKKIFTELINLALARKSVTVGYTRRGANIRYKGANVARILTSGEYLKLALALDPAEVDSKYRTRDYSSKRAYQQTPVVLSMRGERALNRALPLLTAALDKAGTEERKKYRESSFEELAIIQKGNPLVKAGRQELLRERVSPPDTTVLKDADAKSLAQIKYVPHTIAPVLESVTIGEISDKFADGERVTLRSLKSRGLVSEEATGYKVTAKGTLSKSLIVTADSVAPNAIKMIVLTGGKVVLLKEEPTAEAPASVEAAVADVAPVSAEAAVTDEAPISAEAPASVEAANANDTEILSGSSAK